MIGAGAIGLLCAYYLSREKLKVRVIERNCPGSGDSTNTGGGIRYLHGTKINVVLSKMSKSFWDNYSNSQFSKSIYVNTGHLFLTSQSRHLNSFKLQQKLLRSHGLDTEITDKDHIQHRWNNLKNTSFSFGNFCNTGGYLDHYNVIDYLLMLNKKNGVTIETNQKVEELIIDNEFVRGVKTKQKSYLAKFIINATGANANSINALAKVDTPFIARRHELLIAESNSVMTQSYPWLIDIDKQVHLRSNGKNEVLIGGFLGKDQEVSPVNYNKASSKAWRDEVLIQAHNSFGLTKKRPKVIKSWAGLYPGTKDYHPVIENSKPGFITVAGFSGTGLMHAPAAGKIVKNLALNIPISEINIKKLSLCRFREKNHEKEYSGF